MILEMKNIVKRYGDFCLNLSLSVEEGCITGLIGRNGAGKSTAFKAVFDIVRPDAGEIRVFGKDSGELTQEDRQEMAAVFSNSGFSGQLAVKNIVPVMEELYPRFDRKRFFSECGRFGLPLNKKIQGFSTGMKAKLKVLLALASGARFLVLDEPTAGLDVVARDELLDLLREYMDGGNRGILISSHISSDLEGLCDDIYLIHEGKILLHEDTDVLLDEYAVLKADQDQYGILDKTYLLRARKEAYGYACLTKEKAFYRENYPDLVLEKGNIDDILLLMTKEEEL